MSKDTKNILQALLQNDDGKTGFEQEDVLLAPLLDEINIIEDDTIRHFVRSVLLKAGCFWEIPASFSGNHHPPDEHGYAGNVLHTKRVVRVAVLMCEAYGPALNTMLDYSPEELTDMIVAACILHDLMKGRIWSDGMEPQYDPMHPYTIDDFIRKQVEDKDVMAGAGESSSLYLDPNTKEFILSMVHSHAGRWSPIPETFPTTIPAMIVHVSDYIASNLHLIADGKEWKEERWLLNTD